LGLLDFGGLDDLRSFILSRNEVAWQSFIATASEWHGRKSHGSRMANPHSKSPAHVALNIEAILKALWWAINGVFRKEWLVSSHRKERLVSSDLESMICTKHLLICMKHLISIQAPLLELVVLDQRVYRTRISMQAEMAAVVLASKVSMADWEAVAPYEEAAVHDEVLLQEQADHDWSEYLEQRGFIDDDENDVRESLPERVYHLRYGGKGSFNALWERIDNGPEFASTVQAFRPFIDERKSHIHPSGGRMLIYPEQYDDVSEALSGKDVRPCDIIVTASKEHLLAEVIASFPCRKRPTPNRTFGRKEVPLPDGPDYVLQGGHSSDCSDGIQGQVIEQAATVQLATGAAGAAQAVSKSVPFHFQVDMSDFTVDRTFLCESPNLKSSKSVNQSTTEAATEISNFHYSHHRGQNPRRVMPRGS